MNIRRRDFIIVLSSAAAWPLVARAQQAALPTIGFVSGLSADASADRLRLFRQGLNEGGYVDGQNVTVEYHWLDGQYDQLPALMADFVRSRVAVIAADSTPVALAAKAATATIPIVFQVGADPVKLGLVANLARPGGSVTGISLLNLEVVARQLGLLHELVPQAVRMAVLVNPANAPGAESTRENAAEAARALGLQIQVLNASTSREIEAAFADLVRARAEALFIAADSFLVSRGAQLATLAARYVIPTAQPTNREFVKAGGLMSYGTDIVDTYRQLGVYTGRILKGTKPSDLPVVQPTKFEFAINLQTARLLGLEVPPMLLARADEVIE